MFSTDSPPLKNGNSTPLLRNLHPFLMTITLVLNQNVWVSRIFMCTYNLENVQVVPKVQEKWIYLYIS